MKRTVTKLASALVALGLAAPAMADTLNIGRTQTRAEILEAASGDLFVRLGFRTEIAEVPPDPILEADLVIGWGAVGGVSPTPFLEAEIPAGCFVAGRRIVVRDPVGCGVAMSFVAGDRTVPLEFHKFAARAVATREGMGLAVEVLIAGDGLEGAILGAIGGNPTEIVIGPDAGIVVPNNIEQFGGVSPNPF
jgi:hypothetical protein